MVATRAVGRRLDGDRAELGQAVVHFLVRHLDVSVRREAGR